MDMGSDEARWLIAKMGSGSDDKVNLTVVQLLNMSKILYVMHDNRWFEPIKELMKLVDVFGINADDHPLGGYKTGDYYKMLDNDKTLKEMGLENA